MAVNFEEIKIEFINADLDGKINIYTTTEVLLLNNSKNYLNIILYNIYQN